MSILRFPLATEKSVTLISKSNTITYVVDQKASKNEIKKEFERLYAVKVVGINISNSSKNDKKAYIKISSSEDASNIAMKLKLV